MAHAASHGLNPLHTTLVQFPKGTNALWNTSILLPSLVLAPVTLTAGPVASWNLLLISAPVTTALAARAAVRRFVPGYRPAFVGGLIYGFSPYMVVKLDGHPNLGLTLFPPLVLICLHELFVRQRRRAVPVGIALGLAATAQLLTGEEMLLTTAVIAFLLAVVVLIINRGSLAHRWRAGAKGLAVAAVVALATSAPFLAYQFAGPQVAGCCLQGLSTDVLDAQTLVIPSRYQLIHNDASLDAANTWAGHNDSNGYLGVPLILLLVVAVWRLRRWRAVAVAAVMLVFTTVLAFGRHLTWSGDPTPVAMPFEALHRLPMFGNIITARFALFRLPVCGGDHRRLPPVAGGARQVPRSTPPRPADRRGCGGAGLAAPGTDHGSRHTVRYPELLHRRPGHGRPFSRRRPWCSCRRI